MKEKDNDFSANRPTNAHARSRRRRHRHPRHPRDGRAEHRLRRPDGRLGHLPEHIAPTGLAADPQQALREIGSAAREATTVLAEDDYLGLLETLDGVAWPAGFRCTAINTATGQLVVWDQESGVPLLHAVAASCVVPMLFPTVTIKGARYMDGGILNHLNAALAPPTDTLAVISCLPLWSQGGGAGVERPASTLRADAELTQLRESTRLVTVEPDFSHLQAPVQMMDPEITGQALRIGKRQAEREAAAIRAAWDL
jgi:NTE family protein